MSCGCPVCEGATDTANYNDIAIVTNLRRGKEVLPEDTVVKTVIGLFPELRYDAPECPECKIPHPLFLLIEHLVDAHDMPRDEIADWLDTL